MLLKLNEKQHARLAGLPKLRVRLCLSSLSLVQKLFHTRSPDGHIWPPSSWSSKLGLPGPEQLSELDLQVKSIFLLPFSVLHPKYIIIDRQSAFLPSCNVSWEKWLECCLPVSGPVVDTLLKWWSEIWEYSNHHQATLAFFGEQNPSSLGGDGREVKAVLLPSPHHVNPQFHPWPLTAKSPPLTPLNVTQLYLFNNVNGQIQLVTPNVTSPPVLQVLKDAIQRGVDVTITTNRKMMVLEQLVTAGTVTEICMISLRKWYRNEQRRRRSTPIPSTQRLEEGHGQVQATLGKLKIGYFIGQEGREVKCHIKCTVFDEKVMVLGSGNMDRASWYTSQELGIAIEDEETVKEMWSGIQGELNGRIERWYGW